MVQLQRKIAFPFVTLIMTLLAVPFAVTTGRRGALYGIGIGIVLAIVYWTALSVFGALGAGGWISPMLAAWAPNILFGAAAAVHAADGPDLDGPSGLRPSFGSKPHAASLSAALLDPEPPRARASVFGRVDDEHHAADASSERRRRACGSCRPASGRRNTTVSLLVGGVDVDRSLPALARRVLIAAARSCTEIRIGRSARIVNVDAIVAAQRRRGVSNDERRELADARSPPASP